MARKEEPVKDEGNPAYVSGETREVEVLGEKYTLRQRPGTWYMGVIGRCRDPTTGQIDLERYSRELIRGCVKEPRVDPDKLKPAVTVVLFATIEEFLGVGGGDVEKNSSPM